MMWPAKEQQFILSFLKFSFGYEDSRNIVNLANEDLDWKRVAAMAGYHGISSILHDCLQKNREIKIPHSVKKALEKEYFGNIAAGLLFEKALKEIIQHFEHNGLTFAVHKGLGLSTLLYPEPQLRSSGTDLDIFIKKDDYLQVKNLLMEIGCRLQNIHYEYHEMSYIGEVKYVKQEGSIKVIIDLHTDFNPNHWGKVSRFDPEGFWDSLLKVKYNDFFIPCLPVEANLIFLSIHCAANHIFDRLINFCDLDLLIRKYGDKTDWGKLADFARENKSRKVFYFPLNFCQKLLGTPVPQEFLEAIRPGPLSISLVPRKLLLLRDGKPPKWLERYMHFVLLDNPLDFLRSVRIFSKRILEECFIKRKTGSAISEG